MKVIKSLFLISIVLFFASCESTKVEEVFIEESPVVEEVEEIEEVIVIPEPTPEELFIESLNNIHLEVIESPKAVNYKRPFSNPFKVLVTDSVGVPVENYPVTITYPSSRTKGILNFTTENLFTNESGIVEYMSQPLNFGVDDFVTFYPTPAFETEEVVEICKSMEVKANIKAKSDITSKGALLFVWDFNEKDRPVNNSYELLSELRSFGITMAGNAPINETTDIGTAPSKLWKKNYEIVEDAYGYLICGTIKFVEPVSPDGDEYKCSLVAEIRTVSMKNGDVLLEKTYNCTAKGKNWTAATKKCKEDLATIICKDFIYEL